MKIAPAERRKMRIAISKRLGIVTLLLCLCVGIRASDILEVSFDELVTNAELIVEGRVVNVEARQDTQTPFIWTHISVEILEVIAGEVGSSRVELAFLGGSIGERALNVEGMTMLEQGERGVFFIESVSRQQVHPLLGWEQGHFRVETAPDGVDEVKTYNRLTVVGIGQVDQQQRRALSKGVARGILTAKQPGPDRRGMQLDAFKVAIREVRSGTRSAR